MSQSWSKYQSALRSGEECKGGQEGVCLHRVNSPSSWHHAPTQIHYHWRSCMHTIRATVQLSKSKWQLNSFIHLFRITAEFLKDLASYWCCCFDIIIFKLKMSKMEKTSIFWWLLEKWSRHASVSSGVLSAAGHKETDTVFVTLLPWHRHNHQRNNLLSAKYPSSRSHACAATSNPAIYPRKKLFREISIICIWEHVAMWPGAARKKVQITQSVIRQEHCPVPAHSPPCRRGASAANDESSQLTFTKCTEKALSQCPQLCYFSNVTT